ncbi:hypothetical protein CFOL_v3_01026 [Cephalotus follicularis]|uniref:Uncharacterized protein n=1 Tax=Cephalotus follicularis TaxID=3775 RepID=A0A1Q3AP28_CEPFO|nr:hypothetical protein CFOL_v3_01026 [Cephalotus follicularis]
MEEDTLYLQLHKLTGTNSEEALDHILTTLWKTRRTGLRSPEKSHFQSLLNLPSVSEVDPVLACLRWLMRKSVHQNLTGDGLLKLFPADLPLDLQSSLVVLLHKYQNQWKDDVSREQHPLPRTSVPYPVKTGVSPSFTSSQISTQLWPRHDDPIAHFNCTDLGASAPIVGETIVSSLGPMPLQHDVVPPDKVGILPRLKSMTWTMEKRSTAPGARVAIITLKLQDYTQSPSGETGVKFQLTRDTLEAMLRSMTYITEELSSMAGNSAGPVQKKQRQ